MRESSRFNNIFTLLNLGVVMFVVVAGLTQADTHNWRLDTAANQTQDSSADLGMGGFFPFGVSGEKIHDRSLIIFTISLRIMTL